MTRFRFLLAAVLLVSTTSWLTAAPAPIVAQTNAIVEKINLKLRSGATSAAQFQPELAEFDALFAAHKGEKSEELAAAVMMKASFYLEVFQDVPEARKLLLLLKTDFPKAQVSANVDGMFAMLQRQEDGQKIQATLIVGRPFPDFQVQDSQGRPLSLAALKGKIVLVDFWATWCPPCVQEMPQIRVVYEKYHSDGFEVVGISLDEEKEKLASFVTKNKMAWPQYFDGAGWSNKLALKYGVIAIPRSYLLDRKGVILASGLTGDELEPAVKKALGK